MPQYDLSLHLIASFSMIGQYFPILFVGPIVGRFGKKISMMIDCILFLAGFLLMGLSVEVPMLYASKFFLGKSCKAKLLLAT